MSYYRIEMNEFPKWIVDADGKSWWLTDEIIKLNPILGRIFNWSDYIFYDAIKDMLGCDGEHKHGFKGMPAGLKNDIIAGKVKNILIAHGIVKVELDSDGLLHCEDNHAVERTNGTKIWYHHGECHRIGGPTLIFGNGTKMWYHHDKLHRADGPAAIYGYGTKEWWINGKRHRENGPAVECINGVRWWWINGKRHRENGPAIENPYGNNEWYLNGRRHREDGPAIKDPCGIDHWYLDGVKVTKEKVMGK